MPRIEDLFRIHRARSGLFESYEPGPVAYISNTSDSNGVVGFVDPLEADTVFQFTAVVINAFSRTPNSCGARVQVPPFLASGRSGNGLLVLEPLTPMTIGQLASTAAYINRTHGWRFTWYRQATKDRIRGLSIPEKPVDIPLPVSRLLPPRSDGRIKPVQLKLRPFQLGELFTLRAGDYHSESALPDGDIPLVSCGNEDNGIISSVDVPDDTVYGHRLTIALNGRPLTTKYHPYRFATKDDVALAIERQPLHLSSLFYIKTALNMERWRYSYYRKCFIDKLRRFVVTLPAKADGSLDETTMATVVEGTPYWSYLTRRMTK